MGAQVHVAVVHLRRQVCLLTCFVHPLTHVSAAALTILRSKHANIFMSKIILVLFWSTTSN